MGESISFVGLDVHAHQTAVVSLNMETGELHRARLRTEPLGVLEHLKSLRPMRAVYESGPTGLGLARKANELGLDVRIATPASAARKATDRVKTDIRDAERLARLLAAGELSFCHVPTIEEERFRDLIRAREDIRHDLMRARHRLSKLLLRKDVRYPRKGRAWTRDHMDWLRALRFEDEPSQAVLGDYLAAVEQLLQRRSTLNEAIERLWPASPHAATIARLRCFRGVDTLTAAGLCAEIGDFGRFAKPRYLFGHLGIVPSEWTTGERRRQGAITKAGSTHARRLLIEAGHHCRHRPNVTVQLERRQRGQDPRVVAVAWRCQRRLHERWRHLRLERKKPASVVSVALARELAGFIWEAATLD
jgi:transposase